MIAQRTFDESLLALERHVSIAMEIACMCRSARGRLGAGLDPGYVLEDLRSFWDRLEESIYQLGDENRNETERLSLVSSAQYFSGQVFVLPMSITLNHGIKPKYVDVILDYGSASTTFAGTMFNGRYSRILLKVNATESAQLSLTYKSPFSFIKRSRKLLAVARTVNISYSPEDDCFEVTVLFGNREQDVGQATFHVEWYPKNC
ncbi:uncharacterized protein LOC100902718 [Galendromus occidentalis]|uniref:Uncharacterized protein LOC100902718 n=1 Tax=Galendromus occidentalis TaxID=34638 RepID=A0AAJ7L6E3_9ACAR|nr:uncharacterized protein LOC100902718 [Galendromus occidentalis]